MTYTVIVVDSTTATRAHFLLNDDVLFVIYDDAKSGSPDIYGMTIDILAPLLAGDVNNNNIVTMTILICSGMRLWPGRQIQSLT